MQENKIHVYNDGYKGKFKSSPIQYIIGDNGCWNVYGRNLDTDGYYYISRNCKKYKLHRWIALNEYGFTEENQKLVVRHLCNNKKCINPSHLKFGTPKENSEDSVLAGIQPHGETSGQSILNNDDVLKIKELLQNTSITFKELGEMFSVDESTIQDINQRRTWVHIGKEFTPRPKKDRVIADETVKKVKELLLEGKYLQKEIALMCGIDRKRVSDINTNKKYKNVKLL
ncbi:HNH endonuclease [Paenibacillus cremeus]|uniref:HNH nuclease domain-containing protein n=1 Tax=Paenibacillus cremeus TaxID=2163881 RepID=A0A559KCI1_9BACL|nr:HNH endonuclease [Paenibacillus cremeus]TVY09837.1 hypothetical protein FPZ49_10705 [Paenibacillus cremeus]